MRLVARRRHTLVLLAATATCVGIGMAGAGPAAAATSGTTTLTGATLGKAKKYSNSTGDTYFTAWAADGNLYSTTDDTWSTFGSDCNANLAFLKLTGADPAALTGSVVKCMTEYGAAGATQGHPDGRNWKANGLLSINGTFYMSVARNNYNDSGYDGRQTQTNGSIIKSTDGGLTWTRSESTNYSSPMFPGMKFAAPSFIQYGRDYTGTADGADTYVYAISNNGFWDNGDSMTLGRVARSQIGDLNATDWQFWTGSAWSTNLDSAQPIISDSRHLGVSSVTYDAGLGQYILAGWYYPGGASHNNGVDTSHTVWNFYQAPSPAGPWTKFYQRDIITDGFYNPGFSNKFTSDDGLSTTVLTTGNFNNSDYYRLHAVPVSFSKLCSACEVRINDADPEITYSGSWTYDQDRPYDNEQRDVHYATANDASATYAFAGTGVTFVSEKAFDLGTVDVYLDGTFQQTVNLVSATRVTKHNAWSVSGLPYGTHTIRIVKKSGSYAVVDAFAVTSSAANDPAATYTGAWTYQQNRQFTDYLTDIHYTSADAASASYTFTGTGIQYVAELANDIGEAEIWLDGNLQATVNLNSATRRTQQTVWSRLGLTNGSHTIRVVKKNGSYATVDAFVVRTGSLQPA